MRLYSHSYWLVIYCTTNSACEGEVANFREFLEKKTQYLMNTLYVLFIKSLTKLFVLDECPVKALRKESANFVLKFHCCPRAGPCEFFKSRPKYLSSQACCFSTSTRGKKGNKKRTSLKRPYKSRPINTVHVEYKVFRLL